jgi:hypothetical protein
MAWYRSTALENLIANLKRYHTDFPGSPCQDAVDAIAELESRLDAVQVEKLSKVRRTAGPQRRRIVVKKPKHDTPVMERILSAIEKDLETGCWNWMGSGSDRYGYIRVQKKSWPVHRLMYSLSNNVTLQDKDVVMHSCDNTWCCNPEHLSLGTSEANAKDRSTKGRSAFSAVSLEQAKQIRIRYAQGESCYVLAAEFGIHFVTAHSIGVGRSWRVLDDDPDVQKVKRKKRFERWSHLTEDAIREIKSLLLDGVDQGTIAEKFRINRSTVSAINTGRRWRHIQ